MIYLALREKVIAYMNSEITLKQLEEWMVPFESTLIENFDRPETDLVGLIELGLAEISEGLLSEDQFCHQLEEWFSSTPFYIDANIDETKTQIIINNITSSSSDITFEGSYYPTEQGSIRTFDYTFA